MNYKIYNLQKDKTPLYKALIINDADKLRLRPTKANCEISNSVQKYLVKHRLS